MRHATNEAGLRICLSVANAFRMTRKAPNAVPRRIDTLRKPFAWVRWGFGGVSLSSPRTSVASALLFSVDPGRHKAPGRAECIFLLCTIGFVTLEKRPELL